MNRREMRNAGFKVSQEAEYDAMREREIEEGYLEWRENGDAIGE